MTTLDPRLPLVQNADLDGKVVLVRFDHNVVKKGVVKDPYRIDRTIGTLYSIVERGGRPILMTHIGRPRDKKSGAIRCEAADAVEPIVAYLEQKLHARFFVPNLAPDGERGILGIDTSINLAGGLSKRCSSSPTTRRRTTTSPPSSPSSAGSTRPSRISRRRCVSGRRMRPRTK